MYFVNLETHKYPWEILIFFLTEKKKIWSPQGQEIPHYSIILPSKAWTILLLGPSIKFWIAF